MNDLFRTSSDTSPRSPCPEPVRSVASRKFPPAALETGVRTPILGSSTDPCTKAGALGHVPVYAFHWVPFLHGRRSIGPCMGSHTEGVIADPENS